MLWLAIAVAAALLLWGVRVFNGLVRKRNQVDAGWSDIDVQLLRRHDLVPRLVDTVRAYAGHEKAVLESVAELRAQAMGTASPARLARIEQQLEHGVSRLLALHEAWPELKASANFLQLQRDLVDVENQLQYARRFYNGAVRELNDAVLRFPDRLVAAIGGFAAAEYFQAEPDAAAAPRIGADA
jgi:LemA protein